MQIIKSYQIVVLFFLAGMLGCAAEAEEYEAGTGGDGNTGGDGDSDADNDGDADADNDGDSDSDSDGDGDSDADGDVPFDTDSICDERGLDIEPLPGRLMLLMDLSSSMLDPLATGGATKLALASSAISNVLESFKGRGIEFGLDLFPDGSMDPAGVNRCGVDAPVIIDVGADNEQAIIDELQLPHDTGATPLLCAMGKFTEPDYAPRYSSVNGNNILVVISDGKDNCGTDCTENTEMLSLTDFGNMATTLCQDHAIKTVTVGFGEGFDASQLDRLAANGCTEYTEHIQTNDEAQLQDALEMTAGLVIKCVFSVGNLDSDVDLEKVHMYFDDEEVPYDEGCAAGVGWQWTTDAFDEIEFCEGACNRINSGSVTDVHATFGCEFAPVV